MPLNAESPGLNALEQNALTVSRFLEITHDCLQKLGTAVVKGEISECTLHNHLYFKIKDENSSVDCLMWGNVVRSLPFQVQVGMQVIVIGRSSVYKKRGTFRLLAEQMLQAGRGLIMERLERLRRQLKQEGVFDRLNRQVPRFVDRVGIITSPEGRVLHDIQNTLWRRNPLIAVKLYPSLVQGEGAAQSLCQALQQAYAERDCDVLIICRGGGSFEDLLPFSDEAVARLTAQSPIPIISAVGHEPDCVLTDYAADVRAATPTAAAEMVSSFTREELQRACEYYVSNLNHYMELILDEKNQQLQNLSRALSAAGPHAQIALQRARLDNLLQAVDAALQRRQDHALWYLGGLEQKLAAASPQHQLELCGAALDTRLHQMHHAAQLRLTAAENQLAALQRRLQACDPNLRLQQLSALLSRLEQGLSWALQQRLAAVRERLSQLERRLTACDLRSRILQSRVYQSALTDRLQQAMQQRLQRAYLIWEARVRALQQLPLHRRLQEADTRLQAAAGRLTALNPLAILQRGYSVTRDAEGQILQAENAVPGSTISTHLSGGTVYSVITAVERDPEADEGAAQKAGDTSSVRHDLSD